MNYVGRLLSNFKGFYNEINSATLTGAIDIVVVKQADGSLISSPFHVRFGKMGVLRSREKVVDIEINGKPVDLHMKLGEQGEAFFVHNASEEGELPEHLATSPIPEPMSLMEAGIREMRLHQMAHPEAEELEEEGINQEPRSPEDDTKTLVDVDRTPTEGIPKDDSIASFMSLPKKDSNQSLYQSVHTSFDGTPDHEEGPGKSDMAVQTEVTGDDIEVELRAKSPDLYEIVSPKSSSGESGKDEETHSRGTLTKLSQYQLASVASDSDIRSDTVIDMESDTTAIDIDASNNTPTVGSPLSRSHPRLIQAKSVEQMARIIDSPDESLVAHEGGGNQRRKRRKKLVKKKELIQAKMSSSATALGDDSSSSQDGYAQDQEVFDMDLSDQDDIELALIGSVSHSTSMPSITEKSFHTSEWAQSQYASAFHPFSDGDITPIVSPCSSRPPSPKSDTEFEMQKNDMGAQTQLTGNNFEDVDQVNWQWGQLPQSRGYKEDKLKNEKEPKDEKPSSGLFHFMRSTKKIRHKPQEEGIYLDDLDLNEMDPEVVALYLTHPKSGGTLRTIQDEDTESGRGASLPQSPVSMMTEHQDRLGQKGELGIPDIALSLCGGLKDIDGDISHERFMQFLVTYDEFVENPSLISNPDLVIRMGEKYYNFLVAGPMLLSAVTFQRPLPEYAVENLIKNHMPKKERRRGWIWWRTADEDPKNHKAPKEQMEEAEDISEASSSPRSPGAEGKNMRRHTMPVLYATEEESDKEGSLDLALKTRSYDMYRKSLKLTSDELMQLNLVEGRNEVTFSVTTQYQGTCSCSAYIYLWKWDDRIVVSDIDGTITRSDVLGQLLPMVGKDWSQAGITHLYSMIHRNGYKFVYLSARAIGQSKTTRDYLRSVRQGDTPLPEGPLLLSPSSLISAFHREVIERKPEEFKISCLRDLAVLFPHTRNPFYAGYGNKINDVWAYRAVGIPISRIFTVNHKGELRLELSHTFMSSYTKLSDVVDHFFPPLVERDKNKGVKVTSGFFPNPDEYSSFTYWREPLPNIDIEIADMKS